MAITAIAYTIIGFIISWIIISIPVWLASKVFSNESSFPRAMAASLLSIIVFAIIIAIFAFIAVILGLPLIVLLGIVLGFIGVLGVYKSVFDVGWLGAFGIAILAFIITIVINVILDAIGLGSLSIIHLLHI